MQTTEDCHIENLFTNVWENLYQEYTHILNSDHSHYAASPKLPKQSTYPLLIHPVFEEFLKVIHERFH